MLEQIITITISLIAILAVAIYIGGKIDITFMERRLIEQNIKKGGE